MRIALACLLLAACGDPHGSNVDAAPHPVDAAPDAKPDGAPPAGAQGMLTVVENSYNGTADSDIDVLFATTSIWGTMVGTDGPCVAYEDPASKGVSAGTVTISGTTSLVTATPEGAAPSVTYDTSTLPTDLFTAGATITVQASGSADVAGFTATAVAPASVAGFTPPTTLNRTTGTTLTWTAGTGPKMMLALVGFTEQHVRIVLCRINDTGSYSLSASNLALLPATSTTNSGGMLSFGRLAETTVSNMDLLVMSNVQKDVTFTP